MIVLDRILKSLAKRRVTMAESREELANILKDKSPYAQNLHRKVNKLRIKETAESVKVSKYFFLLGKN